MDGAVVGGEGGQVFAIFDEVVGKEKTASGSATYTFFIEIGRITGNVEDYVAGMIVECGIGVGCRIV